MNKTLLGVALATTLGLATGLAPAGAQTTPLSTPVSTQENVRHLTTVPGNTGGHVVVEGNRLYMGNFGTGLSAYDITDPRNPIERGHHSLPRVPVPDSVDEAERFRCTTHKYSILPTKDRDRYLAAVPYYMGGIAVVDFSDPSKPRESGFYLPDVDRTLPDMWSGYWYNGKIFTNEHASQLGVSIFERDGLGGGNVRFFRGAMNPQSQVPSFR